MSHFTVMVVGNDIDEQLRPFHEFECTGVDEFIQDVERTDEARKQYGRRDEDEKDLGFKEFAESWFGYESLAAGVEPSIEGKHKYGYIRLDENGEVANIIQRTNPNAQWDWYVVGGRWSDMILLKNGQRANCARKEEIDLDGMRAGAVADAETCWDDAKRVCGDLTWKSWKEILADTDDDIEQARERYGNQEAVKLLRDWAQKHNLSIFFNIDQFLTPRQDYIDLARNRVLSCFALLKDGVWHEQGKMGWFGMSTDKVSESDWYAFFAKTIDELPDDTILTVVDCHI